ncbi:hypothetical protein F4809DRAFT_81724 [Biscogniauxia mediterranea]|nr:hypothetical protein F4809DRAFT_81724 [Biscogniauxia mediterranea]
MAPALPPRSPIVARAERLSPGAIAGVVVGSVVGGSFLLVVLGFLYFRYQRRLREAQAGDPLAIPKGHIGDQSTSSPWQGVLPGQTSTTHSAHPPSDKDLGSERAVPAVGDTTDQHRSPVSPHGDDWMRHNAEFYPHQVLGQDSLPQDVDFSLPARESTDPNTPVAANSDYYDLRISMHSEPEQPYLPPSRQMSELYRAQQKDAEEHKKRTGSFPRRLLESFKRKRSTQSSGRSQASAPSPPQQYFPVSPVESPINIKQEPGLPLPAGVDSQSQRGENRLFTEPEEIPESVAPGTTRAESTSEKYPQHHKRQKRWTRDSQYGDSPLRTDSAIRETTERDPELPSAALRTDSTYGLPPAAQPPPPVQPQQRLKSPDIPEPMDIDGHQSQVPDQSVFRGSHSPPLPPESFVVPMAVMQPTNALEKAAYTDYQMENSASPPAISPTPPDIITDHLSHDQDDDDDLNLVGEHDFADKYLDLPDDDDEPRLSGDSYEYSTTTPGQSSTDPSCGRTPDTRITASPSPFPTVPEHVKVEISPSTSPEVMRLSPQGAPLTCEDCGRQFDQIHKLNHHKRYHDRKHECPYDGCDKKFGTKTHLDRHINDKHEKLKAYHCTEPTCPYFKGGKFFARKDNWRRHMVKKHGAGAQDLEAMDESHG